MSLLTIIQNACDEISIPRPSSVIGNTDQQIRTLLAMSNHEGRELVKAGDWTVLQRLHTITTASSGSKGLGGGDRIQATMIFERLT